MGRNQGVAAVFSRELRRMFSQRFYPLFLLVLPLLSFAVLWAIFQQQVPRELPVVVCDEDHSALSREITRMIDATPSMRIVATANDFTAGRSLIMARKAYALIRIPAGTEREVDRGRTAEVACFYNAQFILPGSLVTRDLGQVVATLAQGIDIRRRLGQGEAGVAARAHAEPIRIDRHALFNPQLNYVYFLLTTLLPTMLQIFILITAVQAIGSELKEETAPEWLAAAGFSTWRAVLGKLLPQTIHYVFLGMIMIILLFHWLAVPVRGSLGMIAGGTVLFVMAYQAMGLFLVSWFANLRLATSAAAFYSAPAFAFTGVTFPLMAMPVLGRLWGGILPLTYYLRLLVGQAIRGMPARGALPECLVLSAFVVILPLVSLPRMGRVMRERGYWGRL
jgi:ABC-2 type transport system permease protein